MRTATKLGLYGLTLAAVFAGALGVGRLVGPDLARTAGGEPGHTGGLSEPGHGPSAALAIPGGLQVSDSGYRLVLQTGSLTAGAPVDFRFRIVGPDGVPVTHYTATHEKDLHLIVARRDLTGFQHLHPTRAGDGTWSTGLTVAEAGQYRVFADFQPAGRDRPLILGSDVPAAGAYQPRTLPAAARAAEVDGYRVELAGDLQPGTASKLTVRVSRAGAAVTDLQPYLGAYGHLVVLRQGDLAYLHVHPDDGPIGSGPEVSFYVEVPSAGVYRLFLDFQHTGTIHTAAFTAVAGESGGHGS